MSMQLSHSRKLVGADCAAPYRMAFPPQELLWLCRFEPIDIRPFLSDHRKGLPYKFVGDRNDRHFPRPVSYTHLTLPTKSSV